MSWLYGWIASCFIMWLLHSLIKSAVKDGMIAALSETGVLNSINEIEAKLIPDHELNMPDL